MIGPPDLAAAELDRRLTPRASEPFGVALSGGGDSTALLLIAKAWAERAGRRLVAFTVDHGLHPASAAWAEACARRCQALGAPHATLLWTGDKPSAGRAAAARAARHRLITEAARGAGARVVLFGHTADDVLEARSMRDDGVRIGAPSAWSPSPVWPQGRGVFILRPLIGARRSALREWLRARAESWIEDPANQDESSPRARARRRLREDAFEPVPAPLWAKPAGLRFAVGPAGEVRLPLSGPGAWTGDLFVLGAAICCASGREAPLRRKALERLAARLAKDTPVSATLGGARILAAADEVICVRETRDRRARGCTDLALVAGSSMVWDGRFEIVAQAPGLTVGSLAGRMARLDKDARRRLARLNPAIRGAVPAIAGEGVVCPTLGQASRARIRALAGARMAAALGRIGDEAALAAYDPAGCEVNDDVVL